MKAPFLFSPGPVSIPDFVQEALNQPVIHHRTEPFRILYGELMEELRYLFQTAGPTCCFTGSGTLGVEAAMYSLFRPGEKVLVPSHGKFSTRWADYGRLAGLEVVPLVSPWGKTIAPHVILEQIRDAGNVAGMVLTHSETSTGVGLDLEEICDAVRRHFPELCILVDGITSVGAIPFYLDAWGIDAAVVASQKSLMNPAGLCALGFSERGATRLMPSHPADSQNLFNYLKAAEHREFPYTPPLQLLYGVHRALEHIREKGYPLIWNEVHQCARRFRDGVVALGGEIWGEHPVDSLTAFSLPGQDMRALQEQLVREAGYFVAGGQGPWKGQVLRVSHMGALTREDMEQLLSAIEAVVKSR